MVCGLSYYGQRPRRQKAAGEAFSKKAALSVGLFPMRGRPPLLPRALQIRKQRSLPLRRRIVSLKKNVEFRRLYRRRAEVGSVLVSYVAPNRLMRHRVGVTTSKKIGKAHERNRARRVIKEAFRLLMPDLTDQCGFDFVFVARARTTRCPMQEVLRLMKKQLAPYCKPKNETDS